MESRLSIPTLPFPTLLALASSQISCQLSINPLRKAARHRSFEIRILDHRLSSSRATAPPNLQKSSNAAAGGHNILMLWAITPAG